MSFWPNKWSFLSTLFASYWCHISWNVLSTKAIEKSKKSHVMNVHFSTIRTTSWLVNRIQSIEMEFFTPILNWAADCSSGHFRALSPTTSLTQTTPAWWTWTWTCRLGSVRTTLCSGLTMLVWTSQILRNHVITHNY